MILLIILIWLLLGYLTIRIWNKVAEFNYLYTEINTVGTIFWIFIFSPIIFICTIISLGVCYIFDIFYDLSKIEIDDRLIKKFFGINLK